MNCEVKYDVCVIGGGHAGVEASMIAAKMGCKTALITMNLDMIANMPCNPSIGGTAKGHLVREVDALGGVMAKAADEVFIQSRMLNKSHGPAVHSLRVQADRIMYHSIIKKWLEEQENLHIIQSEVVALRPSWEVETHIGNVYKCKAVIICTGTYLKGKVIIGESSYESGPDGLFAARSLSGSLRAMGVELLRFKTGTSPRVLRSTVDFSKMTVQEGDPYIVPFSFDTERKLENKAVCYLTHTNKNTHDIIKNNIHRSPGFRGQIKGIAPRYCPSIEDKVIRFAHKDSHQLFVEPVGLNTQEMYLQGFSTSMPTDVQEQMVHSIAGLEAAHIMRYAYAIEYDCVNPSCLKHTLEFKDLDGLYGAGQFNGTSGYEEAAAQGIMAGINAALKILGREQLVLRRNEAYIGVLIDDLVVKGTVEPYRMLTARAEYRLLLRQDNADFRLMPFAYEIGAVSQGRYEKFLQKKSRVEAEIKRLKAINLSPARVNDFLRRVGSSELLSGTKMSDLIKRPELDYKILSEIDYERPLLSVAEQEAVGNFIKYEGYIKNQTELAEQNMRLDEKPIPEDIDYSLINGLRTEARQKLQNLRPQTVGRAKRISGVSPADINILIIHLKLMEKNSALDKS